MIQQQQQLMNMNQNLMSANRTNPHQNRRPPPQMLPMNRGYGIWNPPPLFQNPNLKPGAIGPAAPSFSKLLGPRSSRKGKRLNKANGGKRMKELQQSGSTGGGVAGFNKTSGSRVKNLNMNKLNTPSVNEMPHQNRLKTRKFVPKSSFARNFSMNKIIGGRSNRSAPYAPRNTTSFIIRAKNGGGIAPLVSPCPATPAVLQTPVFSPSKEVLVDMAKEEWGVDAYGSMNGLIRLRLTGNEMEAREEEGDEGGSCESDLEDLVDMESRLDHDLSRFEMIYSPKSGIDGGMNYHNLLENHVDDQDTRIAQLEEENLILKRRLVLMERELEGMKRRMQYLETRGNAGEVIDEEVIDNESENGSESVGEAARSVEDDGGDSDEEDVQGSMSDGNDGSLAESLEAAAKVEVVELDAEGLAEIKDEELI